MSPPARSSARSAPRVPHRDDLRGWLRLGTDATLGITDLVEAVHGSVLSRVGLGPRHATDRTGGLTGLVYRSVRGTARWCGRGADALLGALPAADPPAEPSARREAALAMLNGVWGDHLQATANPLAIKMALRSAGRALPLDRQGLAARLPSATGRIAVLVHGLCMNDLQWQRDGHDHGQALAQHAGWTPVYLHYNSGRHVSDNGQDFSALLEELVAAWPVPVAELAIVGHSMGGLVARSACHQAGQCGAHWLRHLKHLVFLGTPHHGAPLERGGRVVDGLFGISRHALPFARIGRTRSAGITDLRFGNLQAADWQGRSRHAQRNDDRRPTPLPPGVAACVVAATTADRAGSRRSRWLGDGLVPLHSALGEHRDPSLALHGIGPDRRLVVTRADHWDLLSRPEVRAALRRWLA